MRRIAHQLRQLNSFLIILIRKTCPCNVYPLEPHFYIVKLGYGVVYLFFLFLLQNVDCGYSLEPPRNMQQEFSNMQQESRYKD